MQGTQVSEIHGMDSRASTAGPVQRGQPRTRTFRALLPWLTRSLTVAWMRVRD